MASPHNGKPDQRILPEGMPAKADFPSAKEIAEAKAAAKKAKEKLNVDWADPSAVRTFVEKYRK